MLTDIGACGDIMVTRFWGEKAQQFVTGKIYIIPVNNKSNAQDVRLFNAFCAKHAIAGKTISGVMVAQIIKSRSIP